MSCLTMTGIMIRFWMVWGISPHCQTPEPAILDEVCDHLQTGKGSRKRAVESSTESTPSKRSKTVPLFTIKSVNQVRVKKFKTTGLDYSVQFTCTRLI